MKRDWTILVDTREKRPLPFPSHLVLCASTSGTPATVRLTTRSARLETGDYQLEGDSSCIIERKAGLSELAHNLLGPDRPRALAALDRLSSSCPRPVLLLEGTPHTLLAAPSRCGDDPSLVLDSFFTALLSRNITPLLLAGDTLPHRRAVAHVAALLLIRGALTCLSPPSSTSPPTAKTPRSSCPSLPVPLSASPSTTSAPTPVPPP